MKKNERLQALRILISVVQDKTPLFHLLTSQSEISPLSKELSFGVCRHYVRLETLADTLMTKRPKSIEVWISILMGLYQVQYLRIPDYAVVQETVALLQTIKKTWAKGLVNAVLRTFCREQEARIQALQEDLAFMYGHPKWLLKRLQRDWKNDWPLIARANDERPPMSLRVNAKRSSALDYLHRLEKAELHGQILDQTSHGIILSSPCNVADLPGFSAGDVSVQDGAAQLAVSLLALTPGLRLLDACCAPGGKTCHILEAEPSLAACVALDIDAKRLERVQENLTRLQLKATLITGDATKPNTFWDGEPFDRILLDAPCSATGVIRRHPDIKLLRNEKDITAIAALQKELLNALWPLLKPGGLLIYATCSVLPEENEEQIAHFLETTPNCECATPKLTWGRPTGHGLQILPGDNGMDGFFYGVLRKQSE